MWTSITERSNTFILNAVGQEEWNIQGFMDIPRATSQSAKIAQS